MLVVGRASRIRLLKSYTLGAGVAQSVKCLVLECISAHPLRFEGSSPALGSTLSVESA